MSDKNKIIDAMPPESAQALDVIAAVQSFLYQKYYQEEVAYNKESIGLEGDEPLKEALEARIKELQAQENDYYASNYLAEPPEIRAYLKAEYQAGMLQEIFESLPDPILNDLLEKIGEAKADNPETLYKQQGQIAADYLQDIHDRISAINEVSLNIGRVVEAVNFRYQDRYAEEHGFDSFDVPPEHTEPMAAYVAAQTQRFLNTFYSMPPKQLEKLADNLDQVGFNTVDMEREIRFEDLFAEGEQLKQAEVKTFIGFVERVMEERETPPTTRLLGEYVSSRGHYLPKPDKEIK